MFQNIGEETTCKTKEETVRKKSILTNAISKKYILLYIITLMVSSIGMGQAVSPCSLAIVAATGANEIPIIMVLILSFIGNIIGCGANSILSYIITILIFFSSFFIAEPKYNEQSRNEKIKFGKRILVSSLIVGIAKVFISGFLIYDFLQAIAMSILTYVLYKIFVNSIIVLLSFNEKRAFSLEEIMGASIMLTIAVCCLGNLKIFDFSIRNILAIFIVLVLGWKNGMLVGATAGITTGVTLGIIAETDPVIIAAYAISGLIAGILNRFGKIGVIVGFILGDIILTYLSNGGVDNLIVFKEILIAGVGLLAVPKNLKLDIENIIGKKQFLPVGLDRRLEKSKETAEKLQEVSKAVKDMASTYNENETQSEIEKANKQIFITELLNYTENLEENILYDNISNVDGNIVNDIYNKLIQNQFIKEKDLINIFAENNNYIIGYDDPEKPIRSEVIKMTEAINSAFRTSKMNFIMKEKSKEEKKNVGKQLNVVSKAISAIAEDLKEDVKNETENEEKYSTEKETISLLLKEKDILVQDISINKKDDDRYKIKIYVEKNRNKNIEDIILNILNKNLKEKFKLENKENIENKHTIKYSFISDDKYSIEIGQAIAIKDGMTVSGDSILRTELKDGKHLLALSDGMGSGPEARKSSQIVISLLKRLLNSGFDKETSIDLINSNLLNIDKDIYATLDIAIVDLYKGTIEFIKNGSSPTYIKNRKKVQMIKSAALPTGIVKNISINSVERKIQDGDIVLMCTDGVVDSNIEYKNKSLWIKYLIEDIQNSNPQKIADLVINEAIDNNYGKVKDDMSILVYKIMKR